MTTTCVTLQSITAVVDKMKAAGAPVDLFLYDNCGHAFMNALTPNGRDKIKGTQATVGMSVLGLQGNR